MTKKKYQLATYTESQWDELNAELINRGTFTEHVPDRSVLCLDDQLHSPTRGTYELTDEEAELLKNDPRIKFINLDYKNYPREYKPPADEIQATRPDLISRYNSNVRNYREFETSNTLLGNDSDANRTGYQLYRCQQKLDPWVDNSYTSNFVVETNIFQYGTGKHIDVIVADDGTWFGHPEFQNNSVLRSNGATPLEKPNGYIGGNLLPGNGYCDLLDLVLDSPYYIDPEWFDADPGTRLLTRWDGTIVPVESVAWVWWSDSSQRSNKFASAGTVDISSSYTRARCNGNNLSLSVDGNHGTPCAALTYGRTQGWAYNSNKWAFNLYGASGTDFEQGFDIVKIFHQNKPINNLFGTKDPTVMSNSWGYRSNKDPGGQTRYYTHRSTENVAYTTETGIPWLSHMGQTGDSGRWKSEMKPNSYTEALDELISSGVIFVGAAGNSNQKQVSSDHPDFNNYITTTDGGSLSASSFLEFGLEITGTTNRRGFPQQGGMYTENGVRIYPVINIGALDDNYASGNREGKVDYSDRGNEIDVYAPADGTLAANRGYTGTWSRPDTYPQYRVVSGMNPLVDNGFSAVCSASEVLTGGTFLPQSNSAFSITTSSGSATITSITLDLKNITTNPDTTPTSYNISYPYDDEAYWTVSIPWTISFNGTNYNEVHVGSNSYLTFGGGSTIGFAPSPSATFPNFNKILISAGDLSCQRIYTDTQGISPNRIFIIRYQGHTSYGGGVLGSPTMEYEYHFFENPNNKIELHINVNGRVTQPSSNAPIIATDIAFGGTSAACPVAAGFLATVIEHNRDWTWKDVKNWLKNLEIQDSSDFYLGTESTTPITNNWTDYPSLEGGVPRVLHQGKIDARFRLGPRPVIRGPVQIKGFRLKK